MPAILLPKLEFELLAFAVGEGALKAAAAAFQLAIKGSGMVAFGRVFVKQHVHGAAGVEGAVVSLHQLEFGVGPVVVIVVADAVAIILGPVDEKCDFILTDFSLIFLSIRVLRFYRPSGQEQSDDDEE